MNKPSIALFGFGDIAQRLVAHLDDYAITGVRRSVAERSRATMVAADCRDLEKMRSVLSTPYDVLVMSFVPAGMSDEGYRAGYVDTVQTILEALDQQNWQPRLIVFVSSTSVYGQSDASWVDEDSVTEPASYSGKRLLEAEQLLANSRYNTCCVRFSGIYGPGRQRLIRQVIDGHGTPKEPILYSNRIHADDCAGVLAHLIERQKTQAIERCYLATDCEPVPLFDVKQWIANALGFADGHLQEREQPARMFRSSKRCSNQRLLASGYEFLYPTFREGYGEELKHFSSTDRA